MTNIPGNQGAIKQSEIAVDNAEALYSSQAGDDSLTVLETARKILSDSLRRAGLVLTSRDLSADNPGNITWNGTAIQFTPSTSIVLKLLQNEATQTTGIDPIDLILTYGASNTPTAFSSITLNNGDVVYIELERELIPATPSTSTGGVTSVHVPLNNGAGGGSVVSGLTVKVAQGLPALASPVGSPQGTICIPLAIRIDSALWWIPHGIFWPSGTSSPLGAVVTSTAAPVRSIIEFHSLGQQDPYGYNSTKIVAPGYQLCDGSIIIDPLSAFKNPTRNADGTPGPSFNAAQDVFVPQIIGLAAAYADGGFGVSLLNYAAGDYVTYLGQQYVAAQSVPSGNIITAVPAFWISGHAYSIGDLVVDNLDFNAYQATAPIASITHPSADPTHWSLVPAPYWISAQIYNDVTTNNGAGQINPFSKYRKTTINTANNFTRGNSKTFVATSSLGYGGGLASSVTLSVANLPAHNHPVNISDPTHTHSVPSRTGQISSGGANFHVWVGPPIGVGPDSGTTVGASATGVTATTSNIGSGTAISIPNQPPPFCDVLKLIRIY